MIYRIALLLGMVAFASLPGQRQHKPQTQSKTIPAQKFGAYQHPYPSPNRKYVLDMTTEDVQLSADIGHYPVLKIYPMRARGKSKEPICRIGWGDSWLWLPHHPHTLIFSKENRIYLWSGKNPKVIRQIAGNPPLPEPHYPGEIMAYDPKFEIVFRGASPNGRTAYYSYFPVTQRMKTFKMKANEDITIPEPIRGKEQRRIIKIRD